MVDFRYHALPLIAVFPALGVGLLMGVAVGDSGLASGARSALRDGLRGDVTRAREEVARRERFEERAWPVLVAGRLRGVRVEVVGSVAHEVRAAVEAAGGAAVTRTSGINGGVYGGRGAVAAELSEPSRLSRRQG